MVKLKTIKRKLQQERTEDVSDNEIPAKKRFSNEPVQKKKKWINKQRVLIFGSRGISYRDRHLMKDLRTLMPHSKPENKMERKDNLFVINEICEMKNCNKCILFEGRLKRDLYMWISNVPSGPSAKFLVESVSTTAEMKLTGNCLKGSRPFLSFDENFTQSEHYSLLKELFVQTFGTPNHHPKSQPFIDHVITFSVLDNRIWFRNYQILSEDGALAEVGPRFVLNPIKIFEGSFGGNALWENPHYKTPALYRRQIKNAAAGKYDSRVENKLHLEATKPKETYKLNPVDEIFSGDTIEKATEIQSEETTYLDSIKESDRKPPKALKKKKKLKQKEKKSENGKLPKNKFNKDKGKQQRKKVFKKEKKIFKKGKKAKFHE